MITENLRKCYANARFSMAQHRKSKSSWSMGLVKSMEDPSLLLIKSDCAVVIRDKYPKAKHHFLVLPTVDIPSIYHTNSNHLKLLDELHLLAINAIELVGIGMQQDEFKIGFHAVPSMQRLHLHVISRDFISSCLKTKKHWNSFNTNLFLDYPEVYKEIKETGSLKRPSKETIIELEATPLKCNSCQYAPNNMPGLKSHLLTHER